MGKSFQWACVAMVAACALSSCSSDGGGQTSHATKLPPASPATTAEPAPTNVTLRELADKRKFYIGAAVNYTSLTTDAAYQKVVAEQYNIITPENEMKFASLHPEPDKYTFNRADAMVAFAQKNGIAVRGHTLVWHRAMPQWLEQGKWDKASLTAVLKDHIQTVVWHFKGKLVLWDVVNEAFNDDGSYRENLWYKVIGPEYIELAFRYAHEADPNALLFYNDYTNEGMNTKSDRIYQMAQDFRNRGVPLNGIGWQMHIRTMNFTSPEKIKQNLERLQKLGLQVQITEMDVKIRDDPNATEEVQLKRQANIYHTILSACLSESGCTALLTWGVGDNNSWLKAQDKTEKPLLFDEQFKPKPAFYSVLAALKGD